MSTNVQVQFDTDDQGRFEELLAQFASFVKTVPEVVGAQLTGTDPAGQTRSADLLHFQPRSVTPSTKKEGKDSRERL